jgi:ribosomal protein S18
MTPPHRGRKAVLPPTLSVSRQIDPFYQLSIRVRDEYKNGRLLSSFVSEMGNLKSRGDTGLTLQSHKEMSKAVRRAMHIGTMSRWSTDDKFRGASASKAALGPAGRLEPARIPAAWKHGIAHISSAPRTRLEKLELERNLEEAHAARMKEVWAQASGQKGEGEKAEGQRSSKMSSEEELKKAREMPVADLPPHMQQQQQ